MKESLNTKTLAQMYREMNNGTKKACAPTPDGIKCGDIDLEKYDFEYSSMGHMMLPCSKFRDRTKGPTSPVAL